MTDRPVHIVDNLDPTVGRTRCGIRLKEPNAMPYVGARFVRAHVEGRINAQRPPLQFCPECLPAQDPGGKTSGPPAI